MALSHASDTNQALASGVIVGSLPGRGRSSSAASGAIGQRPLDAALDRLMMNPKSLPHRKERRVLAIGQQHLRPRNPARRLGSRGGGGWVEVNSIKNPENSNNG